MSDVPGYIGYPCSCGERHLRGSVAPLESVLQHLRDAHTDQNLPSGVERWKPDDIDNLDPRTIRAALAVSDLIPVVGDGTLSDATHPDYGPVQVTRNPTGSIRSVFTVEEGGDGKDVTLAFVDPITRRPTRAARDLEVVRTHEASPDNVRVEDDPKQPDPGTTLGDARLWVPRPRGG